MIIDPSAIIAILCDEPEREKFVECITKTSNRGLSAAGFVEASVVLQSRYGYDGVRDFDLFLAKAQITLIPVDIEQAKIARQAFKKYGKGRHSAGLNFGDCFSYAAAKSKNEPLLFKGNDFSQTDIVICNY